MRFKKITIKNFGIYKGQHDIDLSPQDGKPIILLGALNGGGKTTFLDALQLALYGKHAKCSNRGSMAYGAFLVNARNRYISPEEHTEVGIEFTQTLGTEEKTYAVFRSWSPARQPENTRDKTLVYCDGHYDGHLSDFWDEFINEFMPLSLSDLFFFDGEKIETFAQPERSSELVKTGLENLLGLDLLTQLDLDLGMIQKARSSENLDEDVIQKVEQCEAEIGQLNDETHQLKGQVANYDKAIRDLSVNINKVRHQARNAGAHLIEERDFIKFELGSLRQRLEDNKQQRARLDAGCGPLSLIPDLIQDAHLQAQKEETIQQSRLLNDAIHHYEKELVETLNASNVDMFAQQAVSDAIQSIARKRQSLAIEECYLGISPSVFVGLEEKLKNDRVERQRLQAERERLLEQLSLLEKKEQTIPDYDKVKDIIAELSGLEHEYTRLENLLKKTTDELQTKEEQQELLNQRYTRLLTQQNKDTFEQKRSAQVVEHIDHLQSTLKSFAKGLIRDNIEQLERTITDKFLTLTRKNQLIRSINIHPDQFSITLFTPEGDELSPDRLSAGERQLLAVAIMWGLAETSGKELPTVIDTPLGRLDGQHRNLLVENYFPLAGKQVILLSTDEEITGEYHNKLRPHISREYHIKFDEEAQSSTILEGYF
ncbi:MAG: DNA sulfur modification protein DndD [Marinospirillum sp.]|uniref:DNA sulfur modification protein DndD n=1 Tax=Marinospirillum sp. TaxID=2183934 RepID=UPI0019DB97AF|nr:DNA sulfur modification protein DndD [Marinospirillum sp.]MBE0506984.1 DNA sulfur modification protein DndD [Marinospirillum sp.]